MLRDPFTGDIDSDAVIRIATIVVILAAFATLGSVSEGEAWYYPYELIVDYAILHSTATIVCIMIMVMGLWWYEQFRGGYF